MPNSVTTEGARLMLAALVATNPYLALLTGAPTSGLENPTSTDVLAKECAMGGYARLRITAWTPDPSASPPFSTNTSHLAGATTLSGTPVDLTHYALVQSSSGPTGVIYSVGTLTSSLTPVVGEQLYVPVGSVKVILD